MTTGDHLLTVTSHVKPSGTTFSGACRCATWRHRANTRETLRAAHAEHLDKVAAENEEGK